MNMRCKDYLVSLDARWSACLYEALGTHDKVILMLDAKKPKWCVSNVQMQTGTRQKAGIYAIKFVVLNKFGYG